MKWKAPVFINYHVGLCLFFLLFLSLLFIYGSINAYKQFVYYIFVIFTYVIVYIQYWVEQVEHCTSKNRNVLFKADS